MPRRIQRKRTKGWRMPVEAVVVTRPTIWQNPCPVSDFDGDRAAAVEAFRNYLFHTPRGVELQALARRHLKGRDICCWCPEDGEPCHGDVWLEVANG